MELARDKHLSPSWHSNRRCAGIAGARLESGRALPWNGRVPSCATRVAGFSEGTTNSRARIADTVCASAQQQARASRTRRRPVPYDLLTTLVGAECSAGSPELARRFQICTAVRAPTECSASRTARPTLHV